jgi:hypothetical protein
VARTIPVADLNISLQDASPSLTFSANATRMYLIQTSTNLINWSTVGTAEQEDNAGNSDFTDDHELQASSRFYRIVTN